jgi:hypothetical protein
MSRDDEMPGMQGIGDGPLARQLREALDEGYRMDDVTVLNKRRDPFRLDTPSWHRDAEWFRRNVEGCTARHLRGVHYYLIGRNLVMPSNKRGDGRPYLNNDKCYTWLMERASKAARWLGYVDFDDYDDHRAAEPVIFRPEPTTASGCSRRTRSPACRSQRSPGSCRDRNTRSRCSGKSRRSTMRRAGVRASRRGHVSRDRRAIRHPHPSYRQGRL